MSTGYGVAEIAVFAGSDMVGQSIEDSGLLAKDLQDRIARKDWQGVDASTTALVRQLLLD